MKPNVMVRLHKLPLGVVMEHPTIIPQMRFKDNLRHYLQARQMTAAELSRRCKDHGIPVGKATISGWLAGASVRNMDLLFVVSRVLGVTVDELLFGDPSQRPPEQQTKSNKMLDLLFEDDAWVSGRFEIKVRRLK
jgi:transcriptional regulator with XRE-family HTH domain